MSVIADHPLRYPLANALHARPFPSVNAPSQAAYLAVKPTANAAVRDRALERAHLVDLLDRFGAQHPQPDATHFSGQIGQYTLKWESHTEFVTYTVFCMADDTPAFTKDLFSAFPQDWLDAMPGARITSAIVQIEQAVDDTAITEKARQWFVPESVAISRVLDNELVIAADFRIDAAGHIRFALFCRPDVGPQRVGRVMQRLCEIETYKAMAMLGLIRAREIGEKLTQIDERLSSLLADMEGHETDPSDVLTQLLGVSVQIENIGAQTAFRFAATIAYEKIVNQRIEVLRETRFEGRQTFGEFMMRRFDPSMRTVNATERRQQALSNRALRAGDLLRTKVDVERSAQNQALLTSMDARAGLQLRLQKTVEGLSIVAISYYGVNLALYVLGPLATLYDISKTFLAAGVTPVVLVLVWILLRRIHRRMA